MASVAVAMRSSFTLVKAAPLRNKAQAMAFADAEV